MSPERRGEAPAPPGGRRDRPKEDGTPGALTARVVGLLVLVVVVVTGAYDLSRLRAQRDQLVERMQGEVRILAETLAAAARPLLARRRVDEVRALLDRVVAFPEISRATLYDPEQGVVATALVPQSPEGETQGALLARAAQRGEAMGVFYGDGPTQVYQYVFPLAMGRRRGFLEIVYPWAAVEAQIVERQRAILISRGIILLAMGAAFWVIMRIHVGRPIRRLAGAMEAVGAGDLSSRLDLPRRDAIGRLATQFNWMADRLQEARDELLREEWRKVELERQIRRQQKLAALGKVSSEIAHEIGTPLNIIAGRAEYLQARMDPSDPRAHDLQVITAQIERITATVKRVLDFARSPEPQRRPVALADVVQAVEEFLRREAEERGVHLAGDTEGAPKASLDPDQIQQVLMNVLMNALEATPRGGSIRVEARGDPDDPAWGRITVADTGAGIPPDVLPRVFEPFITTKGSGRGTGLGLAISRDLVRAHGGEMSIASEPGRGTTVTIRLPVEPPPAPEAHVAAEPNQLA